MIVAENLSKRFTTLDGDINALDGVSFKVSKGEFLCVVGSSGAGKTTLINMLGGLDTPDGGKILFEGEDITRLSDERRALLRRRRIGIIYQFYNLIPELNVKENIILPAELDGLKINEDYLSEILDAVGLSGRQNAYPDTLSGGQQQRVAIARALYMKPCLLLADEPTGNLDQANGREILRLILEMNKKQNVTVIAVTHSADVANAADRVITVENGRITDDRRR